MKKLLMTAFCAAALTWGGCSDDSEGGVDRSRLLGAWTFDSVLEYDADTKEWEPTYRTPDLTALEFYNDGTVDVVDVGSSDTYRYSISGKRLTIRESDFYSFRFTITLLTDTALELRKKDVDDDYKTLYVRSLR